MGFFFVNSKFYMTVIYFINFDFLFESVSDPHYPLRISYEGIIEMSWIPFFPPHVLFNEILDNQKFSIRKVGCIVRNPGKKAYFTICIA